MNLTSSIWMMVVMIMMMKTGGACGCARARARAWVFVKFPDEPWTPMPTVGKRAEYVPMHAYIVARRPLGLVIVKGIVKATRWSLAVSILRRAW
jgi:hypothetical protein